MTQTDYEQKKRECWEEFIDEAQSRVLSRYEIFSAAFDRAYALGKQKKEAEGDEMLSTSKTLAFRMYDIANNSYRESGNEWFHGYMKAMVDLLGNIFPPVEIVKESKKPKYSIGQPVYLNGVKFPFKVRDFAFTEGGEIRYRVVGKDNLYTEDALSPADWCEGNVNLSQETANCDKQFDDSLDYDFSNERRLNIAAMIEPALINNPDLWKQHGHYYAGPGKETKYSFAKLALEYADALIAESESSTRKGGRQC